ncbi:hypothetical protein V6N13_071223 [Hibiscus sabdariffa]|uniref:Protein TILLER ANGLE CONTROL 1 n=1 Tax=Hibiscus sabdariffa TaxID=183260 RepID=A0ABR2TE11_9ROSI
MKIFNWVQKRFHHNVLKDGVAPNVNETDQPVEIDPDAKALLEQVPLSDMLDGWQDGILTIGTFGFNPLQSFAQQNHYSAWGSYNEERYTDNKDDEDVENDSDEEVNPLMLSAFGQSLEDADRATYGETAVTIMVDGVSWSTDHEIKLELEASEGRSGKLRRTTLAELFSEDSDIKKKPCPLELDSNSYKKPSVGTKNGLSFAKKLIPQVGQDLRPIKMLHQMMRRMLKRKIHPELQGKANKLEGHCKATIIDALATESVSML